MESVEARDKMTALVKETYAKFPAFHLLPEVEGKKGQRRVKVEGEGTAYVTALHKFCAEGSAPTGRDADFLVG